MLFDVHALGRVAAGFPDASGAAARPVPPLPDIAGLVDGEGLVDYRAGLALQHALRDEVRAGVRGPVLLLLEHTPVYTAGRRTEPHEHPYDGTDVVEIDRGGKLTWHGPGQLVAYPVGALRDAADARGLVRDLERALVAAIAAAGLEVELVEGRSGAWLPGDARGPARKVAAIGLSIRGGVSTHGVAVNCGNDLRPFGRIVPCGISDAGVGSFADEGLAGVTPAVLAPLLAREIDRCAGHRYAQPVAGRVAGEAAA